MAGNWHLQPEQLEEKLREFLRLHEEIGANRFAMAVDAIIHDGEPLRFFPSIGEFKIYVPKVQFERDEKCECGGTGWLIERAGEKDAVARRCANRKCLKVKVVA